VAAGAGFWRKKMGTICPLCGQKTAGKTLDRRRAMAEAIKNSNLSIPQVARLAEMNQQTIYNFLAGRNDMMVSFYDRIMKFL